MDDLRERMEAALSEAQFQAQHLANDATRTARWEAHTATLREALAHPERLMGEPVARVVHRENTTQYAITYTHMPAGTKLYAPPEVKPRQQVDSEHRICEHGRDAFADDCGMCDRAGTNYAKEVKPYDPDEVGDIVYGDVEGKP